MPKKITASAPAVSATPRATDAPALTPAATTVLSLLDAQDGTTTADLAESSGLGRSTVTKSLSTLHEAGLAVRHEGGHEGTRRIADRWFAAPETTTLTAGAEGQAVDGAQGLADPAEPVETVVDENTADTISDGASENAADDVTAPAPSEAEAADNDSVQNELLINEQKDVADAYVATEAETDADPNAEEPAEEAVGDGVPDEALRGESADAEATEAVSAGQDQLDETDSNAGSDADDPVTVPADVAPEQLEANDGGGSNGERGASPLSTATEESPDEPVAVDGVAPARESAETKDSGPRLGKGELRAQVEGHLSAHPEQAFTPTQLHHVLNRSSGAIANACDKLVEAEKVVIASDKPRRFQWKPAAEPDAS